MVKFPVLVPAAAAAVLAAFPAAAQSPPESDPMEAWVEGLLHWTTRGIEVAGIGVIVFGAIGATAAYLVRVARGGFTGAFYERFRSSLGRSILLGLEFLVAADIINTVAIDPTLESVAVLAGVVLIRTFLSYALEVEISGRWPWQKQDRR